MIADFTEFRALIVHRLAQMEHRYGGAPAIGEFERLRQQLLVMKGKSGALLGGSLGCVPRGSASGGRASRVLRRGEHRGDRAGDGGGGGMDEAEPTRRWGVRDLYFADTDTVPAEYNEVRHAGVTMSLYQAAGRLGDEESLAAADRGLEWMQGAPCAARWMGGAGLAGR